MMRCQPNDVKREFISVILGDLREFKRCAGQLHLCGQELKKIATSISDALGKKVKREWAESARVGIQLTLENVSTPFHALLNAIPQNCIDIENNVRVRSQQWNIWLETCWGNDYDTISMLAMLPYTESLDQFLECVEKLPLIQIPFDTNQSVQKKITDSHIYSGALYPPCLQWAYFIKTGAFRFLANSKQMNLDKFRGVPLNEQKFKEPSRLALKYLSVAKVLLGAIADLDSELPITNDNDTSKCPSLLQKIFGVIYNDTTREELITFLKEAFRELGVQNEFKKLDESEESENIQGSGVGYFLREERKYIAKLLWYAYRNQLGIFTQEVLLAYLRCKGAWFQNNSGINLNLREIFEYLLFKSAEFSVVTVDNLTHFHEPMSKAVNKFYYNYNSAKSLEKIEVRLPCMELRNLKHTLNWLDSVYENLNNIKWEIVLSFPRFADDGNNGRDLDFLKESYLKFIDAVLDDDRFKYRVCGIDIRGTSQNINWENYAKLINELRTYIRLKTRWKPCFVAYHLSEDTCLVTLKEICEIWTILSQGKLSAGDRISHGLCLIVPPPEPEKRKETVTATQWVLIERSLRDLVKTLPDTFTEKSNVDNLYEQLYKSQVSSKAIYLDYELVSKLVIALQPYVKETLISNGIIIEICPTSNWRVTGISLPTKLPIDSWIKTGGKWLVGTAYPAIFPCTIESEYYSIIKLVTKGGQYAAVETSPDFGPEIDWKGPTDGQQLQSYRNNISVGFSVQYLSQVYEYRHSICHIETCESDPKPLGTGFLMTGNLVLTNYHVLEGFAKHLGKSIDQVIYNIILRFSYFTPKDDNSKISEGRKFNLSEQNPILDFSPTDKLDYILLRVNDRIIEVKEIKPVKYTLSNPSPKMGLSILQHPRGRPLMFEFGVDSIVHVDANTGKIQYYTETAPGSSGSPCFNEDMEVFALHHAEQSRWFGVVREGILLSSIYPKIENILQQESHP